MSEEESHTANWRTHCLLNGDHFSGPGCGAVAGCGVVAVLPGIVEGERDSSPEFPLGLACI